MKSLKARSKLIALGLLIAVVAVWSASRTGASTGSERLVGSLGAAGLVNGQTFRFNVVNVFADGTSSTRLKVCSLQCNGQVVQVAEHTFTLAPGQCESFDFDPAQSQIPLFDPTGRAELFGLLMRGGNGNGSAGLTGIFVSGEVFDNITGKTAIPVPAVLTEKPANPA